MRRRYDLLYAVGALISSPVLAVGPYGCKVLGTQRLKNGHPYT